MGERRQPEMRGHGLAHVGEAFPAAQVAWAHPGAEEQHRHVLAGMVGAGPGRIAAMVGGDQRQIAGFKPALMGERARRPFALFFEDRGDGLFHAVRAAGETWFGLAVLLLRE